MFNFYKSQKYKLFIALPLVLYIVLFFLAFVYPGVPRGIDLSGGTLMRASLDKPADTAALKSSILGAFKLNDLQINTTSGPLGSKVLIQFSSEQSLEQAKHSLEQAKLQNSSDPLAGGGPALEVINTVKPYYDFFSEQPIDWESHSALEKIAFAETAFNSAENNFSQKLSALIAKELGLSDSSAISKSEVGASLGENFYSSAIFVTIIAFFLLSLVIFAFFREIVPSALIIAAAIFDILGALGLMAVFGIPLSLSTIPALLMLIGYSVDTDILLTSRVMKRKDEEVSDRAYHAMLTGLTMTMTALVAFVSMLVISFYGQITVVFEIAAVLFFGLLADIISTWLMNAPMLLWYDEKNKKYS